MQEQDMFQEEQTKDVPVQEVEFDVVPATKTQNQYLALVSNHFRAMVIPKERDYSGIIKRATEVLKQDNPLEYLYSWVVTANNGKSEIVEGGSVELAKYLLSEWRYTHIAMPPPVQQTYNLPGGAKTGLLFTSIAMDALTGNIVEGLYFKHITAAPGRFDADKWFAMQFGDGRSRCFRDAIFKLIPGPMVNSILTSLKGNVRVKIEEKIKNEGNQAIQEKIFSELKQFMKDDEIKRLFNIQSMAYDRNLSIETMVKMTIKLASFKKDAESGDEQKKTNGKQSVWQKVITKAINNSELLAYLEKYVDLGLSEADMISTLEALPAGTQSEIKKHFGE